MSLLHAEITFEGEILPNLHLFTYLLYTILDPVVTYSARLLCFLWTVNTHEYTRLLDTPTQFVRHTTHSPPNKGTSAPTRTQKHTPTRNQTPTQNLYSHIYLYTYSYTITHPQKSGTHTYTHTHTHSQHA
jgi:hypothetical protein